MQGSGSPDRALVMRSGADSEMTSGLSGADVDVIKQAPGIRRDGQAPLAAAELMVIIDLPKAVVARCAGQRAGARHRPGERSAAKEFSIVEGRMFKFGTNEVIVGRGAQRDSSSNLQRRRHDRLRTEPLARRRHLRVGRRRAPKPRSGSTRARCRAPIAAATPTSRCSRGSSRATRYDAFRDWLTSNPQLNVSIRRENEYYATQSQALTRLISTIGFGIAALMGIGAVFGAILTMYTAVATRAREIATLRALGFNTGSVLVSVLAESMVLGLIGGAIGGAAAYLAFNGYQTSTMNFQTFSQVAFAFRVTPRAARDGTVLRAADGTDWRAVSGHPRCAACRFRSRFENSSGILEDWQMSPESMLTIADSRVFFDPLFSRRTF